jgi:protocatechuate 3,4-dioxygenase beta subunit
MVRADVTEGRPGVPTELQLQVVDAMCRPLANARVDIWHCDATGLYSGYPGQGDDGRTSTVGATFMRGTQMTNAAGVATFRTVYPGWYRGRTTHIHFKVLLNATSLLNGQLFFPDTLSEYLYRNVEPYKTRRTPRDTANNADGIARQAGAGSQAYIKERSDSYLAAMVIGVNPNARPGGPSVGPAPGGFPPGGPGGPPPAASGAAGSTAPFIPGARS